MAQWMEYNPNPKSKRVGDCTVRALCAVLDQDWYETFIGLALTAMTLCDMPSANSVWGEYLREKGFKRSIVSADCPSCYTVKDFCNKFTKGRYVLALDSHVICVIDGCYYDSFDSGEESPIYYWEKEDENDG